MSSAATLAALTRPEDQLILALLSHHPSQELIQTLATKPDFDWVRFFEQSLRQSVTSALTLRLKQYLGDHVPQEITNAFQADLRKTSLTNMAYVRESIRIAATLEAFGISALFYKGVVLSTMLYTHIGERKLVDVDILVAPEQLLTAKQALIDLGYSAYAEEEHRAYQHTDPDRTYQGYDLVQNEGLVAIDLQERFGIRHTSFRMDFETLWAHRCQVELGGRTLNTLSISDYALALCAHGVQHRWQSLKWVSDIAKLTERDGVDWASVFEAAQQLGAVRMVGVGLALAEACFDVSVPQSWQSVTASSGIQSIATSTLHWIFRPIETLTDLRKRADFDFRFDWAMRPEARYKAQITWFLLRRRLFRVSDDEESVKFMKPFRVLVRPVTLWQRYGRGKGERVE